MTENHPHAHPHHPHPRPRHGLPPAPGGGFSAPRFGLGILLIAAAVAALWQLGAPVTPRLLVLAVEADDAASLCRKPACSLEDFWDRAAAAGAQAVVLRERPLKTLADRGEVLHVAREEFEKWRALGLVAQGAILKPDTIWIKDPRVLKQVQAAAMRQGVVVSTASSAGFVLAQFPEGYASVEDSLGAYDAEVLASLEGRRLAPLYSESWDGSLGPVALRWDAQGKVEGFARSTGDWMLAPKAVEAKDGGPAVLRAAFSHPDRLLILRLQGVRDPDAAIELVRSARARLSRAGFASALPAQAPRRPEAPGAIWLLVAALWLIGISGPLLAARAGLTVLKRCGAQARQSWPVASPVLQLAVGMAVQAAVAAAFGILARGCVERLGWAQPSLFWMRACVVVPIIVGLLTLYTIDGETCGKALAAPLTNGRALVALSLAAAALLILDPRWLMARVGALAPLGRVEAYSGAFWWLTWRWREALVGVPCLLEAMFLIDWRLECPDCAGRPEGALHDARSWFLPGLLAPAGVATSLARLGLPLSVALAHTAAALGLGVITGAALIAARMKALHRPKGPEADRSLVLEGRV